MKKKILAIILAMAMMLCCFSACDLVSTNAEKDMAQAVAEVDISQSEEFQEGGEYEEYKDVIQPMSVSKRELVAYFVNTGYNYISQGQSYEDTFKLLVESMVNYKIIVQYAMVYFFEEAKDQSSEYYQAYSVSAYNSFVGDSEGNELLMKTLEYFLDNQFADDLDIKDEEGNVVTRYDMAVYNVKTSINSAIDSQEAKYVAALEHNHEHGSEETRAIPTGVNAQVENYFDSKYDIYTGVNGLTACGTYEKVDGGTVITRKKAYNAFLNVLKNNHLISDEEVAVAASNETDKGITATNYYKTELSTQLQTQLSRKLTAAFETKAAAGITADYIKTRYEDRLKTEKEIYDKDVSAFETAIGSVSDSSFTLYAPEGATEEDATQYGFVYNILLPFSTQQSYELERYQDDTGLSQVEYFEKRAALLEQVKGKDQRSSWFDCDNNYSFDAENAGLEYYNNGSNSQYLFFEESMTESTGNEARYETLHKYYGYYPYNGEVSYDPEHDEYDLTPNKVNLTDFLTEMESYMNFALENDGYSNTASAINGSVNLNGKNFTLNNGYNADYGTELMGSDGKIDYSKFVYYVGQVGNLEFSANNALANNNAAYTALSAFNELQFAYSTDTGCLNTYYGYSISRYSTSYVGEFEYAAKLAISQGVGTYTVCPSDFGWHIIYCTYTFDKGSVYGDIDWTQYVANGLIDEDLLTENSFEYFYYESLKSGLVNNYETELENIKINAFNNEDSVKIYENRYSDYTIMDKTNPPATSSDEDEHAGHNH